jgi:hypothetical protein
MPTNSSDIEEALRRLYAILSSGDAEALADIVTTDHDSIVGVGLDGGLDLGAGWLSAFQEQLRQDGGFPRVPGERPQCFSLGDVGWFADRPTLHLPDGSQLQPRLSGVMRHERGAWRLVQLHASLPADGPSPG